MATVLPEVVFGLGDPSGSGHGLWTEAARQLWQAGQTQDVLPGVGTRVALQGGGGVGGWGGPSPRDVSSVVGFLTGPCTVTRSSPPQSASGHRCPLSRGAGAWCSGSVCVCGAQYLACGGCCGGRPAWLPFRGPGQSPVPPRVKRAGASPRAGPWACGAVLAGRRGWCVLHRLRVASNGAPNETGSRKNTVRTSSVRWTRGRRRGGGGANLLAPPHLTWPCAVPVGRCGQLQLIWSPRVGLHCVRRTNGRARGTTETQLSRPFVKRGLLHRHGLRQPTLLGCAL